MGDDVQSKSAILQGTSDGQVAIRRADEGEEILINSVRLGPQPTPLLHGDKVEIAGQELLFVDDRRSGSTQFIQAVDPASMREALKAPASQVATASTGGRLVSLTDGREYSISGGSLLIGREAGCDVVVPSKNVSRRHAEIVATPKGYILIDSSTNGTFVNAERVQGQRLLARADVVRCGDYEFRFYADVKRDEPPVVEPPPTADSSTAPRPAFPDSQAPPPRQAPAEAPEPPLVPPTPPPGAEHRLANTMHGIPIVPRPQPPQKDEAREPAQERQQERPPESPQPPPGAEVRLSDTLLGVPVPPRPSEPGAFRLRPPADPSAGAAAKQTDASRQPKWPPRPAQPGAGEKRPPAAPAGAQGRSEGERAYPRTGEREAIEHVGSAEGPKREAAMQRQVPQSLAALIVRSGPLKGRRFEIRVPVVNVGRADYNDIVLPDESVSTVHAKIQRREGIWVLVDQESTNGTLVDGEVVRGETVLAPGALVKFGSVQTMFQPTDDAAGVEKGGATKVLRPIDIPSPDDERRRDPSQSGS